MLLSSNPTRIEFYYLLRMESQWSQNAHIFYDQYLCQQRPDAPVDTCKSATLSEQPLPAAQGDKTDKVAFMQTSSLTHHLFDTVILDVAFVKTVLSSCGPIFDPLSDAVYWQWKQWPRPVKKTAKNEKDYYDWLDWVVFQPATHAVAAVRDQLYASAGKVVPREFQGNTATECVTDSAPRGVSDIVSQLNGKAFVAHEIKRTRVLRRIRPEERAVLAELVKWASRPEGFSFRDADKELEKTAKMLLFQVSEIC